jgi:hypothetical protein
MFRQFVQAAMVVVLALVGCKAANAQMVLYDNFDATSTINPAKWAGVPGDPHILDELRELAAVPGVPKDKQLHLYQKAYGATTDNSGSSGGLFGLSFLNPSAVTAISFTLVVNKITQIACKTNPGIAVTGAGFLGSFFSIDASPTSSNDDVTADIQIEQNVCCGGPRAVGYVTEQNGTMLDWQELGPVTLKSTNTLFLQWDQPNHRFIFQLNGGTQVFEPYSVSDTSPPFYAFKNLKIARAVADCTSTPRPYVLVDADFDNVYVNQ